MKTLLITGVHSVLGKAVARWAPDAGLRVIGVDRKPAPHPITGPEFIQTDINNPLLPRLLKTEGVDAIFHGAFLWRLRPTPDIFENNVVGTTKLLEAAAEAGVKKIVFPSSAFVYGAHPDHPYLIPEDAPFRGPSNYGYIRDLRDIETFLSGFQQRHPEMTITILRFANLLGRGYGSPLARYLSLPLIPVPKDGDPLIQVLHVDDAVRAVIQALEENHAGVYNLAAQPPITLRQAIERIGRHAIPLPDPILHTGQNLAATLIPNHQANLPIPWEYLRYSWPISTRRIRDAWDFVPVFDTETILDDFAQRLSPAEMPEIVEDMMSRGKQAVTALSASILKSLRS